MSYLEYTHGFSNTDLKIKLFEDLYGTAVCYLAAMRVFDTYSAEYSGSSGRTDSASTSGYKCAAFSLLSIVILSLM